MYRISPSRPRGLFSAAMMARSLAVATARRASGGGVPPAPSPPPRRRHSDTNRVARQRKQPRPHPPLPRHPASRTRTLARRRARSRTARRSSSSCPRGGRRSRRWVRHDRAPLLHPSPRLPNRRIEIASPRRPLRSDGDARSRLVIARERATRLRTRRARCRRWFVSLPCCCRRSLRSRDDARAAVVCSSLPFCPRRLLPLVCSL